MSPRDSLALARADDDDDHDEVIWIESMSLRKLVKPR
jgi:hypothetical protein